MKIGTIFEGMRSRACISLPLAFALGAVVNIPAWAQGALDKSVRWVVPYPAGGGSDFMARTVAQGLQTSAGAGVVVDNKPGGNGAVAVADIKRASRENITWINVDNGVMVFNPALYSRLGYDPEKDLRPVTLLGRLPMILVAGPSAEVSTAQEWLAKSKANPGKFSFGSAGAGSPQHMAMELLKRATGTFTVHIPYRGSAPALADLVGGQIPVLMTDYAAARGFIQSGKIKALAVANATRVPYLPEVPTLTELGVRNAESSAWVGVAVSAATSDEVVRQTHQAIRAALTQSAVSDKLSAAGIDPIAVSPEQFEMQLKAERQRWQQLIRELKITLD